MMFLNYLFQPDVGIAQHNHKRLQGQREYMEYKAIHDQQDRDIDQRNYLTKLCVNNWEMSGKIKVLFNFLEDWAN